MRPNIILIMTDQHALHALRCYDATVCKTPNIDSIASDGVKFQNAFSPCALCAPARASLLSGLYPHKHGILGNDETPRPDLAIYPDALKNAGYQLGYSGKWHAGIRITAADAGFTGYGPRGYGSPRDDSEYNAYLKSQNLPMPEIVTEFLAEGPLKYAPGDSSGYHNSTSQSTPAAFIAHTANNLLDDFANSDQPFFLACNFWGPHAPYLPSLEYKDLYDPTDIQPWPSFNDDLSNRPMIHSKHRKSVFPNAANADWSTWAKMISRYYAQTTMIDHYIGTVLDKLKQLDLYDNSMVFFTADHGETIGIHGGAFDKGSMPYEEVYRIPMIVKLPQNAHAGSTRDQFVTLMDLTETFCAAAQTSMPAKTDGQSILPILTDPNHLGREHFVAQFHRHRFPAAQRILWHANYKYILNFADTDELYNLQTDPAELTNLINDPSLKDLRNDLRQRMLTDLEKHNDNQGPQWKYILERPLQP